MLRHAALPALGLGLVALTTGCPLLEVQAEVQEVCLTYRGVELPGAPDLDSIDQSVTFDDLGGVRDLVDLDAELRFVRAELRAASGIDRIDFVQRARLSIASGDPSSPLPTLDVYHCDGDCLSEGNALAIPAEVQHDAIAYLASRSIVVDFELAGRLPAEPWTADIDVCFTGRINYAVEP